MSQEPQRIGLELIRLDESVWPRAGFDHDRVDDFAELFEAHGLEALPPIVIVHDGAGQFLVCDGHHRMAALHQVGAGTALTVTEALPDDRSAEQFAFEYAVQTAAQAAKPLTRAERDAAVERFGTSVPTGLTGGSPMFAVSRIRLWGGAGRGGPTDRRLLRKRPLRAGRFVAAASSKPQSASSAPWRRCARRAVWGSVTGLQGVTAQASGSPR